MPLSFDKKQKRRIESATSTLIFCHNYKSPLCLSYTKKDKGLSSYEETVNLIIKKYPKIGTFHIGVNLITMEEAKTPLLILVPRRLYNSKDGINFKNIEISLGKDYYSRDSNLEDLVSVEDWIKSTILSGEYKDKMKSNKAQVIISEKILEMYKKQEPIKLVKEEKIKLCNRIKIIHKRPKNRF
jgi:hypothetical protein